jgi:hypothetical protein
MDTNWNGVKFMSQFLLCREPVEWDKNILNLEGFSEFDWFPTKNFVTLDVWRQKILNQLGIK